MHRIPQVSEGTLRVPGPLTAPIAVGSTSWVSWLADPGTRSFSFRGYGGNFTARKELRSRGGEYWVAYRRRGGKLHKTYVGKAEDLTLTRLQDAAAVLAGGDGETVASPPPDATTDDAETAHVAGAERDDSATANRRSHRGDSLLVTKLSVPSARRSLVARPRLGERLDEGLGRKLTLLSAPAGFGKTTLLSAWIGGLSDGGRPVAWFSLDPGDNDPARFWRYFITAVDQLQPGSGKTALALLDSPRAPPIESILTSVLNELAGLEVDAVLVLDDYHLIEHRTIHEDLTFLLEHLPPRLRLMIATRADPPLPLSRLRAGGEMDELRAADLRFTPEEAATFLNRVMGLELAAEDIAELEERTEGWIAGLQLAALAMRDHADVPGFIAAFTGSNRFVVDYLAEEVLQQQPEALRTFLLRTSVLDRMCAPLCQAVSTRDDGQEILERLEHANLFVIPLDDERHWYRYHHLFAEVLRQRLDQEYPDLLANLHRSASAWFEREGLTPEAVNHALEARDWGRAVRLIEASGMTIVFSRQVRTVLGWIDEIPQELARERPVLCIIRALALMLLNRPDAAEASLQEAERCLRDPTTEEARTVLGRAAVIRAAIARSSGDLERCVVMGRRALELLPETEFTLRERAAARTNVALAYLVSGDVAPANERPLKEATASFRASSTLIPLLMSINFLARMRTLQGRLRMAAATYEEAVAAVSGREGLRDLVNNAAYYVGLGDIHREWNDLDSAERYLKRGVDLFTGTLMVDADVVTHGYLSLTRLLQTRGRHADARATLEEFADLARQRDFFPLLLARGEAAQARLALMHDDFPSAVSWAEDSGLGVDDEVGYPSEEGYLTLARVLVARGRVDQTGHLFDEGLRLLDRLLDAAEAGARMGSVIEIQALRALTLHARSETRGAFAALERALVLAEPEGYVRVFVDEGDPMKTLLSELVKARRKGSRDARKHAVLGYARRLLAQGQDRSRFDPLTAREREVLELIVEGLSNQEIAARLFIAVSTVKGYVHIIFRKLDADSRTIAVARARELQLFSE